MLRWTVRLVGGSPATDNQSAVVVGHRIYSFGGDKDHIEVYVLNTLSLTWARLTPGRGGGGQHFEELPSGRRGHTAALVDHTAYLWGGTTGRDDTSKPFYCNVLYAFDLDDSVWFKPHVSGAVPKGRSSHSACVLGKVIFIYGGFPGRGYHLHSDDIYKLDTATMVWSLVTTRGTRPDIYCQFTANIVGTKMYVFGSCGEQCYLTFLKFDTEDCWMTEPSVGALPDERENHSAFTHNGRLYIFGGCNWMNRFCGKVLWKFTPETCTWKKVKPKGKGPNIHASSNSCCCTVGDRVFFFGSSRLPGDLYVLDFSPSLKTFCEHAVIRYRLDQSELTEDVRWELAAMTSVPLDECRGRSQYNAPPAS